MPFSTFSRAYWLAAVISAPVWAQSAPSGPHASASPLGAVEAAVATAAGDAGASDADAQALAASAAHTLFAAQEAKLTASDGAAGAEFGFAVALSGDYALVGAPAVDAARGAAYVFARSGTTWTQQARLASPAADPDDLFGWSVTLSGDRAFVGAPGDRDAAPGAGAVYEFTRSGTTWTMGANLLAADAADDDAFGYTVALDGDLVVVGAYRDDDDGTDSGSAYVFDRSGGSWAQTAKLTADDADAGDQFGGAVALSGDRALVGAHLFDGGSKDSGAAYVFVRGATGWTQEARLRAGDRSTRDNFGRAVALSGDRALVGAPNKNTPSSDSGAAYVFARSETGWTQETRLSFTPSIPDDNFGFAVALSADRALVGAYRKLIGGSRTGGAYTYTRAGTTWTLEDEIAADDGADNDQFALGVALDGTRVLIGARGDDDDGSASGSAYVFSGFTVNAAETPQGTLAILPPAPNPTTGATRVTLSVPTVQAMTVDVFDALGRRVATLHDGVLAAGETPLTFDASALPAGVYVIRAVGEAARLSERVTVVR